MLMSIFEKKKKITPRMFVEELFCQAIFERNIMEIAEPLLEKMKATPFEREEIKKNIKTYQYKIIGVFALGIQKKDLDRLEDEKTQRAV